MDTDPETNRKVLDADSDPTKGSRSDQNWVRIHNKNRLIGQELAGKETYEYLSYQPLRLWSWAVSECPVG
jgi:hypothetical protein